MASDTIVSCKEAATATQRSATRRREIERTSRAIRINGERHGRNIDEILDEILDALPDVFGLEAWRLAYGWTRKEACARLDELYELDGLEGPHLNNSELCRWELKQRKPSDERIEYLCRLYRTRPDRLGFGADYSYPAPTPPAALAHGGHAGPDTAGLVGTYPRRADVPADLWWQLFARAGARVDILVYAAIFLHEQHPDFNHLLATKAQSGCKIRIALGDPDSPQVRERGAEERFGHGIETRCRVALLHYRPLIGLPGIEIHLHRTTLYNSLYRVDDEMIVNTHVYGHNAYSAPVLHVRRMPGPCLFDTYADSFDAVWGTSTPATIDQAEAG